jgi:serine/threonine protein kinase
MLVPQTVLQGRYLVVRQLGQGGMGAVYEAIDQRLDTTVALKETLFTDERLRKQFEREARLLARLHHPALPRVSDHFSEGEGQFLVMQYIAGDDLSEMLNRRRGPFPPDQVMTWADQLLDALDYLHTQDPEIIHRDIKPQNLKLTARGQIILLDFGLAKGQAGELSRVTTAASIFGYTPNYAPLEQIQGLGTDVRSDLYALAATIYHLITGVKPPDALTRAAAIVNGQPDPLRDADEVNRLVGNDAAAVLRKAMAQNREQRYATAADMRRALSTTALATTVTQRGEAATVLFPPGKSTVVEKPLVTKNETVHTGETTVARKRNADTQAAALPRAADRRRLSPWVLVAAAVVFLCIGFGGFYAYQHRSNQTAQTPPVNGGNEPTPQPSPSLSSTEAVTNQPATEPKKESGGTTTTETAKKKEKPAKPTPERKPSSDEASSGNEADADANDNQDETPEPPNRPGYPNVPPRGSTVRRTRNGVVIRTFANGSQMVVMPDGTRILTTADGQRHVINQGDAVRRKRQRPKY